MQQAHQNKQRTPEQAKRWAGRFSQLTSLFIYMDSMLLHVFD